MDHVRHALTSAELAPLAPSPYTFTLGEISGLRRSGCPDLRSLTVFTWLEAFGRIEYCSPPALWKYCTQMNDRHLRTYPYFKHDCYAM